MELLRLPQVIARTALSRSTIYELMARGEFPRPLKVSGARLNAWSAEEIDHYIRVRAEQRLAS
jgi:prophage regulatory protein